VLPLVLLPGMNCTADLWAGAGLDDAITPDLYLPDIDQQVDALLADLPDRFVLAGLSLGAIVGMALAHRAPERVAGLCVMSTNAKAPTLAQRDGWQAWIDRLDAGESARALQQSILGSLLSEHGRAQPELVERTLTMGDDGGADLLRAQLRMQQTRTDLRPGLAALTMPMLVIGGQQDAICPPTFHAEIAAGVPHSRFASIEGGHLLTLERPDRIGALVRTWRTQNRI
jgi:pimeloyl-ACP methyl ester carboxylesterase